MAQRIPQFEKFTRRGRRRSGLPMITLQQRGTFSLNKPAYEALGEPDSVELLYDRAARIVGVRATDETDPDAYSVRKQQSGYSYLVAAQAFCLYYDIPLDSSRRYAAELLDDVLVIDLN